LKRLNQRAETEVKRHSQLVTERGPRLPNESPFPESLDMIPQMTERDQDQLNKVLIKNNSRNKVCIFPDVKSLNGMPAFLIYT
jgi:hypothetical protein